MCHASGCYQFTLGLMQALSVSVFLALLLTVDGIVLKLKLNSPEDVCVLFPNGAILRKPGSCRETIKCQDGRSSPHTVKCSGDKFVKLDKMTCAADSGKDKYCTPTCAKSSPRFIEDTKNCQDWAECNAGKLLQKGSCPDGQIFDKEQQRCLYDDGECNKTYDICQVAKTNQKFWDKKHCQKYYYCNANKVLVSEKCPLSKYYEVSTGMCVEKNKVDCSQHPVPDEACGTKKLALLNYFIADQSTCRGYFYCRDLGRSQDGNYIPDVAPLWGQCKPNEFFDAKFQYCRDMNNVKCNEDRCDSISSGNILSETPGCQHYLVCKDGFTEEEVKCPDNKYFDPVVGYCVNEPVWYPICG